MIKPTYELRNSIYPFRASGGAKFTEIGHSLSSTPTNRHAKFDAVNFILGGEIRTVQTHKITNKQTVNDIGLYTICLSACVDNKLETNQYSCDFRTG